MRYKGQFTKQFEVYQITNSGEVYLGLMFIQELRIFEKKNGGTYISKPAFLNQFK